MIGDVAKGVGEPSLRLNAVELGGSIGEQASHLKLSGYLIYNRWIFYPSSYDRQNVHRFQTYLEQFNVQILADNLE